MEISTHDLDKIKNIIDILAGDSSIKIINLLESSTDHYQDICVIGVRIGDPTSHDTKTAVNRLSSIGIVTQEQNICTLDKERLDDLKKSIGILTQEIEGQSVLEILSAEKSKDIISCLSNTTDNTHTLKTISKNANGFAKDQLSILLKLGVVTKDDEGGFLYYTIQNDKLEEYLDHAKNIIQNNK